MDNRNRLKRLLNEACIAYTEFDSLSNSFTAMIWVHNMFPCVLFVYEDGIHIRGQGYHSVWKYSPEYVVRMLDRKFRQEREA